ncbi:hypothetical protein [Litorilituus sediminis]|uniref:Uncharacterized protein n=1 Tax=Litorilituus sediminis TaxID=718192 RepID=A0A4P6P5Z9_9GAMM|nr:hypothetical protein [Litorilituus sediminis]QBG36894.1 hypothetical protein EMK97_14780 [Litorilituus sediminis]
MKEQAAVKNAINAFYKGAGLNLQFSGTVTPRVAEVFGKMVFETQKCTSALNWVPRPAGGKATISWVARNFTQRILSQLSDKQSLTCAKVVIRNFRTDLQMASMGQ